MQDSPTPHGVGGLKFNYITTGQITYLSHPTRGGWIEISRPPRSLCRMWSHPTRGGWIEMELVGVAPPVRVSHPTRGGWIEIAMETAENRSPSSPTPHGVGGLKYQDCDYSCTNSGPTPHGVGGLKLRRYALQTASGRSHPTRGGWIEILLISLRISLYLVPPHTGWVD